MKISKTVGDYENNEVYSEIDLFSDLDVELKASTKRKIQSEVADYLINETLNRVAQSQSPVSGESFSALSKNYKKEKEEDGRGGSANLEFTGKTLQSLTSKNSENGILLGHFNNRAPIADGHLNFSGDSLIPQRRYIPAEDQEYKAPIKKEVEQIVTRIIAEDLDVKTKELDELDSKASFYQFFSELLNTTSRVAIREAIIANEELFDKVKKKNLIRFF